jgi:hypothetical protein
MSPARAVAQDATTAIRASWYCRHGRPALQLVSPKPCAFAGRLQTSWTEPGSTGPRRSAVLWSGTAIWPSQELITLRVFSRCRCLAASLAHMPHSRRRGRAPQGRSSGCSLHSTHSDRCRICHTGPCSLAHRRWGCPARAQLRDPRRLAVRRTVTVRPESCLSQLLTCPDPAGSVRAAARPRRSSPTSREQRALPTCCDSTPLLSAVYAASPTPSGDLACLSPANGLALGTLSARRRLQASCHPQIGQRARGCSFFPTRLVRPLAP